MVHRWLLISAVGLAFALSVPTSSTAQHDEAAMPVIATEGGLEWGPAPPALPPGAKLVVLLGDPAIEGKPYVMRLWAPAGYVVSPHWHPTAENVTVLDGSIHIGMGDTVDRGATTHLVAGEFFSMPAHHHHFAIFDEETTLQLHGIGPFGLNYVNPDDDPRKAMPTE